MSIYQSMPQLPPTYVAASQSRPAICFGALVLYPTERRLECDGQPLRISSRAFDILLALLEQPGEVVPHRILMARAWPGTNVEEANLRVHVAGIRKLLGSTTGLSHNIINVPGRGYAITGPVGTAAPRPSAAPRENPQPDLALLAALFQSERLMSLVGAGGIGKNALAAQFVQGLAERLSGVRDLDLAGELADFPSAPGGLPRRS
jgi:DNA-binding winged helix-turn-helix (wHTH) protein